MVKWIKEIVLIFAVFGFVCFQILQMLVLGFFKRLLKLAYGSVSNNETRLPSNALDLVRNEVAICFRFFVQFSREARLIEE